MLTGYSLLVLIFSICYGIFFFFRLRNVAPFSGPHIIQHFAMRFFLIALVLLILPRITYSALNPENFFSPDIFAYMHDVKETIFQGHIPELNIMKENLYYATFPIFTLLISTLTEVSGLPILYSVHILNVVIQALFWFSVCLVLNKVSNSILLRYFPLGIIIAAYANPYLYGYFETVLPQTIGLSIILLLFFLQIQAGRSTILTFILLTVVGLVHVTTIPVFIFILVNLMLIQLFSKLFSTEHVSPDLNSRVKSYALHMPTLIYAFYVFNTIAIIPVVDYLQKIVMFLLTLQEEALRGEASLTAGLSRGILYPLNALGPALVIGATIGCVMLQIYAIFKRKEFNSKLGSVAITALILIFLGTLRQRFDVWGIAFFSISRYFSLPGYALATVVATWVIANVLFQERKKWRVVSLLAIFVLSALGGLLDPLARTLLSLGQ